MENTAVQLPDDPHELKELVVSLQKKIIKLESENFLYRRELFGRKSEKRSIIESKEQDLFNEIESGSDNTPVEKERITYVRAKKRGKKVNEIGFPPELPRKEIIHKLKPDQMLCSCGKCLREFFHREHEELAITEPKMYVLVHKYFNYICDDCEKKEKEKEKQDSSYIAKSNIITAPGPKRLLPGSRAHESTLAFILTAKFCDGLPFYRMEKILSRYNVKILRNIMCNWAMRGYQNLLPFFEILKQKLFKCPVIGVDETKLRVLEVNGARRNADCFMWVFRGLAREGPVTWYHYAPTRGSSVLEEILKDYNGIIVSDDWGAYSKFSRDSGMAHVLCNSHARRKFVTAYEKAGRSGEAKDYLDWYAQLYKIEDDIRESDMSPIQITEYRQKYSKPIMVKMKTWLEEKIPVVLPESDLGKAISYSYSNWEKLTIFLDNGLIPIDNNMTENAIRPFVIGRKNYLFSAIDRGAEASAGFYTLIESAKANGLEPYWYLRYLFTRYPNCNSVEEMEKLLPMNVTVEELNKFKKECSLEA